MMWPNCIDVIWIRSFVGIIFDIFSYYNKKYKMCGSNITTYDVLENYDFFIIVSNNIYSWVVAPISLTTLVKFIFACSFSYLCYIKDTEKYRYTINRRIYAARYMKIKKDKDDEIIP